MDVQNRLDAIVAAVENARSMPMSASCVVNRAELVGLLQDLRSALPAELAHAQSVMADHEQVVADAQAQAEQIIQGAHSERGSLISDTEVVRRAQAEADRILGETRTEVQTKLAEADDYVDSKLANFEVVLTKTLGAVGRGRQKLRGEASVFEQDGDFAEDGEEFRPRNTPSPEVDEYVDVKLATLETVLSKTLEAVGKGRDKLLGKAPIDELGAYLAAADEAQQLKSRAEAVAAGFAEDGEEQPWYREELPQQVSVPQQQSWPEQTPAGAGWQAPGEDQYAAAAQYPAQPQGQPDPQYAEVYGGGYDPAGPPQTDPYGNQYGYQPQYQGQDAALHDPYGVPQGYAQPPQGYPGQQVGQEQAYDAYGYPQQQGQVGQQAHLPQQAGLDETSFFDTSMIDMTRLRELGGR
ncbi:cell division initiation protein [Kitasatospora sp. MAP5-34]|uniref:cell division initiation protein n=1 Tax=Kitasatospora sp. MAP5-34 TaxID=3035102 RepID=UPI0024767B6F|nr:cell division initiation protein [Kitasatospora sp. MAP5-34]MDH6578919.1 vacuolar-type H+-ATPase subunit H [Kitasatospora sp. MAP5-34]